MKTYLNLSLVFFAAISSVSAQMPQWWVDREVIDPQAVVNDYGAVNQGQVKHLAAQAYEELQANLPGGAGAELQGRVAVWRASTGNDYLPVNLGQLKNVVKPIFDRLIAVGYSLDYPWTVAGTPNDFALANVGQAKNLFAFDIGFDSDSDGLPDWWEMKFLGGLQYSGVSISPGDSSLMLAEAWALGRDPHSTSLPDGLVVGSMVGLEVYTALGF